MADETGNISIGSDIRNNAEPEIRAGLNAIGGDLERFAASHNTSPLTALRTAFERDLFAMQDAAEAKLQAIRRITEQALISNRQSPESARPVNEALGGKTPAAASAEVLRDLNKGAAELGEAYANAFHTQVPQVTQIVQKGVASALLETEGMTYNLKESLATLAKSCDLPTGALGSVNLGQSYKHAEEKILGLEQRLQSLANAPTPAAPSRQQPANAAPRRNDADFGGVAPGQQAAGQSRKPDLAGLPAPAAASAAPAAASADLRAAVRKLQAETSTTDQMRAESLAALEGKAVSGVGGVIANAIRDSLPAAETLFRGVGGDYAARLLNGLRVGAQVDLPLSSFSAREDKAEKFSRGGTYADRSSQPTNVMLHAEAGTRALDVNQTLGAIKPGDLNFTHEQEFLTAGRFQVSKIVHDAEEELTHVHLRQVATDLSTTPRPTTSPAATAPAVTETATALVAGQELEARAIAERTAAELHAGQAANSVASAQTGGASARILQAEKDLAAHRASNTRIPLGEVRPEPKPNPLPVPGKGVSLDYPIIKTAKDGLEYNPQAAYRILGSGGYEALLREGRLTLPPGSKYGGDKNGLGRDEHYFSESFPLSRYVSRRDQRSNQQIVAEVKDRNLLEMAHNGFTVNKGDIPAEAVRVLKIDSKTGEVTELPNRRPAEPQTAAGGAGNGTPPTPPRPPVTGGPPPRPEDDGRITSGSQAGIAEQVAASQALARDLEAEGLTALGAADANKGLTLTLEQVAAHLKDQIQGSRPIGNNIVTARGALAPQQPGETAQQYFDRKNQGQFFQKYQAEIDPKTKEQLKPAYYGQITHPDTIEVLKQRTDSGPARSAQETAIRQQSERVLGSQVNEQIQNGLAERLGNTGIYKLLDGTIVQRTKLGGELINNELRHSEITKAFTEQTQKSITTRAKSDAADAHKTNQFIDTQRESSLGARLAAANENGTATRIGQSRDYRIADGQGDPLFVQRTEAGAKEIREVNARADAENRYAAQINKQANEPKGFVQGFTHALVGRGYNGQGDPTDLGQSLTNFGGTAGNLVKYAAAGVAIGLVGHAVSDTKKETLDYIDSLTNLRVRLDDVGGNLDGLTNHLEQFSRLAGSNVGEVMDAAAKSVAAFGNPATDAKDKLQEIGEAGAAAASKLAVISGTSLPVATGNLVAIASSYGTTTDNLSSILDAVTNAKRLGGDANDITAGLASFAGVAQQAGFDPNQAAQALSLVGAKTNTTGANAATQLTRIVGIVQGEGGQRTLEQATAGQRLSADSIAGSKGDLIDTKALAGNVPAQLAALADVLPRLSKAEQGSVLHDLGGVNNLRALQPLLVHNKELMEAYAYALDHAGAGTEEFNRLQADLTKLLQRITGDITNIQNNLSRSGIFDGIGAALTVIEPSLRTLGDVLGFIDSLTNKIPGLKSVGGTILDLVLILKVLRTESVKTGLSNLFGNAASVAKRPFQAAGAAAAAETTVVAGAGAAGAGAAGVAEAEVSSTAAVTTNTAAVEANSGALARKAAAEEAAATASTAAAAAEGRLTAAQAATAATAGSVAKAEAAVVLADERVTASMVEASAALERLTALETQGTVTTVDLAAALDALIAAEARGDLSAAGLAAGLERLEAIESAGVATAEELAVARDAEAAADERVVLAIRGLTAAEADLLRVQALARGASAEQAAATTGLAGAQARASATSATNSRMLLANIEAQELALGADAERIAGLDELAIMMGAETAAERVRIRATLNTVEADTLAGDAERNRLAAMQATTAATVEAAAANEVNAKALEEEAAAAAALNEQNAVGGLRGLLGGAGRGIRGGAAKAGGAIRGGLGTLMGSTAGIATVGIGALIAGDAVWHAFSEGLKQSSEALKHLAANTDEANHARSAEDKRKVAADLRTTAGEAQVETPKAGFLGLGYLNIFSSVVDRYATDKVRNLLPGYKDGNEVAKSAKEGAKVAEQSAKQIDEYAAKAASRGGTAVFGADPGKIDNLTAGIKKLQDAGASAATVISTLVTALGGVDGSKRKGEGFVTPYEGAQLGSNLGDGVRDAAESSLSDYIHGTKGKSKKQSDAYAKEYIEKFSPQFSDPKKLEEFQQKVQQKTIDFIKSVGKENGGQLSPQELDDLANQLAELYVDPKQSKKGQDAVRDGMRKYFREALAKGTDAGSLVAQGDQTASDFVQNVLNQQSVQTEGEITAKTGDPIAGAQARLDAENNNAALALDKGTKVTEQTIAGIKAATENLATKIKERADSYSNLAKSELSSDQVLGRTDIDLQIAQRELADALSRGDLIGQNNAQAKINDLNQSRAKSVVEAQNAANSSGVQPGDAVEKGVTDLQNAVNTLNHTTQFDTDGTQTKAYSDAMAAVNAAYRAGVDAKVAQANAIIGANRDPRDTVGQAADALVQAANVLNGLGGMNAVGADGKETAEHAQARAAYNAAYRGSIDAQITEINADRDAHVAVGDSIGELRAQYYDQLLIAANNIGSVKDAAERRAGELTVQINRAANKLYNTQLRGLIDPRDELALAQNDLQTDIFDKNSLAADDAQGRADADVKINQDKLAIQRINIATNNAKRTAGTDPSSQLEQAKTQLQNAADSLAGELPGTTAYYNALDNLHQKQDALAAAQRTATSNSRKLGTDLTDPVQQAQEALRIAQDKLRDDAGKPQDVIDADNLAIREAQNGLEAAQFSKNLSATQTAEQLGKITHRQYLDYLQNEHNRLTERIKTMKITDNGYQQAVDELNQIDQAAKAANDALQGQFNLGDITVPSVYEVRRSIAQDAVGAASNTTQSNVSTVNSISINGADLVQVKQFLTTLLGADATSRTPVQAGRKV